MTREQIEARLAELKAKQEAATGWGAAVGDRHEQIKELESQLLGINGSSPETRHPVERLWREVGLPEYFLGNDGSNTKLYALYDAILARGHAQSPEQRLEQDMHLLNNTRNETIEECAQHLEKCGFRYSQGFDIPDNLRRLKGDSLVTSTVRRRPLCSLCGLEDGACVCHSISRPTREGTDEPRGSQS